MPLLAVGLNHNTAPVNLREQISIGPDETVDALRDLVGQSGVAEAAILSTCNRTELYCRIAPDAAELPIAWLHQFRELDHGRLDPFTYRHHDQAAVRHMLRVAAGLDSMVLGEPEILGQMKKAYRFAQEASSVKSVLDRLFQHTFSAAKQVRTDTEIGREPVSVAFAAVTMARRLFGSFRDKTVLLIGAGETIDLAAQHLHRNDSVGHLIVANRTVSRAQALAQRFEGAAIPLDAIENHLGKADLIFSSTGAAGAVVTLPMMQDAISSRKRKPVFIVDLAVPRDIEAEIGKIEDVYLYTVDDLEGVVDSGLQKRKAAARQADSVIEVQTEQYMRWLQAQQAVGVIRTYREFMEDIRGELTDRAQQQIASGQDPAVVLEQFAHRLVQKMLHAPSANLRRAGEEGRHDVIDAARELLAVEPPQQSSMQASLLDKLGRLVDRHEELAALLADPEVIGDQKQFAALSREYSQLEPVVQAMGAYSAAEAGIRDAEEMLGDEEMRDLAQDELTVHRARMATLEEELQLLLLPRDPRDDGNVFLEIRAGTGGDEAALFAGDLFRMYEKFAEQAGWRLEVLSAHAGEHGGFKEIITRIVGQQVYSRLKFESGAHRVQRVPETESQGRIHTSACTVAVLPELDEIEAVDLNPNDLRIDTFRSSGAGGQHVNTTDSAIRITHLPTGIVVECQDERSQHKNKARAMTLLNARILDSRREKQQAEQSAERRDLVGSGDRSQRIRTYNYPQARVTDHRINLTLYKLDEIMQGGLDHVIDPLTQEHQAGLLAALSEG